MIYKNYQIYISLAAMVAFSQISVSRAATVIENNVSSSANSSGNSVSGTGEIKTGNASAESSVNTKINSGGESKIEVNAKAEANGKKVETNVTEENPKENLHISKEIQDGSGQAKAEVNVETGKNDSVDVLQGINTEAQTVAAAQSKNQENSNFFIVIARSFSEAVKSIFDKVSSFFG
jgi:hypothetical protein